MAEYHASSAYGGNAYPGGSRQPARGYDNSAKEYPTSISETASTYSQGSRSENSAPTIPGMEHLSINSRLSGPEHIDAADFYRFHSQPPNTNWRKENTTPGPAPVCKICLVTSCVMNGGSKEAERLKTTMAKMKAARSKAQMLMLGMEYMEPYIEAYDNLWKSDESNMRTKIKENLSVPGGKLFAETSQGLSPVTIFTSLGKTELVAILLHEGVDINDAPGGRGKPLGHAVAWLGNDDLVEMLLAAGADPNSATDRGVTALHVAVSVGNIKAVKQLVNAGADIDAKLVNFGGVHSLPVFSKLRDSHMATYGKIIDFLVESGASTDLHDTTQWTPLQYICISGSVELVRRLTEIGVPKEPLVALRKLVASDWVMSGYYKNWEIRLEEDA
ncbi:hypothetical protein TWF225_004931 [Orbilia oligospora]|uniref:Uncharacterized protein n=1 Tax=Orbilia oligospora TaxID=2813651 RepID=A0A7C8PXT5_ORBOL|nr:hypothetical protein TWF751_006054 [Orbilia oligospora]KAF3185957.1 hypothetical protein TWF225_004931 [Orbilia oligospora]KAF3263103.1 hypothetical protein TWF128_002059 [Orbilia oligospora]KAF3267469.1 hypothetical protein TWF217_000521 [Orbilia oligospora]KAF3294489.1 hypothetical protein TWF132_003461 [Orbilia oligospora]